MAFVKDINFILGKMTSDKLPFYTVYDADGKTVVDENQDGEVTVDEARSKLENTLSNLTGLMHVKLCEANKKQRGAGNPNQYRSANYTIKTGDENAARNFGSINGPAQTPGFNITEMEARIKEQFDLRMQLLEMQYKHKAELDAIKNDNAPNPYLIKGFEMLAGAFAQGAAPQAMAPAIAGPETAEDHQLKIQRLNGAVKRLLAVDPDFTEHLEKLADIAENNKGLYDMAISFLNK